VCSAEPDTEVGGRRRAAGYEVYVRDLCFGLTSGGGTAEKRFARSANNPPFVMRLRRMGHPALWRHCRDGASRCCCCVSQLQSHAPLVRFAKAPVPPPLQTQADGFAAEQEDGVATLQSAQ
jgi:hypothetical protein